MKLSLWEVGKEHESMKPVTTYGCVLTSAMAMHVIMVLNFQVAKVTTFPFSVNKINFDHLIYEPYDTHKVYKYIKL